MNEIKIEKEVPVPTSKKQMKYPWQDMKVGDSFLVPDKYHPGIGHASPKRLGFKFTTRREGSGTRVWRIE